MAITLAEIESSVQNGLRNTVNSPFSQSTRIEAYNRVIDFLQSKSNWNFTRRVAPFDFLNREVDYSLSNDVGITDFKQYEDLRFVLESDNVQLKEFEEVDPIDFSIYERRQSYHNYLNFEERDGSKIMRVLANLGKGDTMVDEMDDLTTGRTWASDVATSDATVLTLDENKAKSGNSLRFNVDVSQSVNDFARIYTSTSRTTSIDGSDIENLGYFRFWMGLHSFTAANLALISSVTFVWGDDAAATPATKANYWSKTVTTTATGGSFVRAWNRMSFDWATATKTGTPDASDLKYFEIQVTYTNGLTDSNNVRIDQIKMFEPAEAELVYFSSNFVNAGGTWQSHFSTGGDVDTTEELLLPDRHFNVFVKHALMELFPQKEIGNNDYVRVAQEAQTMLDLAINMDGNAVTREKEEFEVDGYSRGRADAYNHNQW